MRFFKFFALLILLSTPALAQVTPGTSPLSGAKGGTNNAFMQFSGPASSLKTYTMPNASGTVDLLNAVQTFTAAKTFGDLTLLLAGSSSGTTTLKASASASGTLTLPAATDQLVGRATTDTLTNKTLSSAILTTPQVTGANANSFSVGLNGATNPAFNVDTTTASQAAGLNVKGAATGGTVALSAIDSGSNTNLSIDAKGTGQVIVAGTSIGGITLSRATTVTGSIIGSSTSSSALVVGANGSTNPALSVDASTASQVAGLSVKGAATAGTVALAVTDSGPNTNLSINAKGTGLIGIGNVSTGAVTITPAVTHAGATTLSGALTYGGNALANTTTGPTGGSMATGTQGGSWTPADASGAGLTFTGVSAQWSQVGNMVFAYAEFTYPSTANGSNASIGGLPVAFPAAAYSRQCSVTRSNNAASGATGMTYLLPTNGTSTISPRNNSGNNITNANMSLNVIDFICIYPAS